MKRQLAILAAGCALCAAVPAHAAKRALLIGVGRYQNGIQSLEGPAYDIAALENVLSSKFQFTSVTKLTDEQATRAAILKAIEALIAQTKAGDYVFLYFSGHGTSGALEEMQQAGIDVHTGAILPYDTAISPEKAIAPSILIGRRDLRPLLGKLDATGAESWVVFDSCFSEHASRAAMLAPKGAPRYQRLLDDLPPAPAGSATGSADTLRVEPYPYRNIVYISAASHAEVARDITSQLVRAGTATFDGKPHGAFTDTLLQGIAGRADFNRDGTITYEELYAFAVQRVKPSYGHTPKLYPAVTSDQRRQRPVFGARGIVTRPDGEQSGPLRLRLDERLSPEQNTELASIRNLQIIDSQDNGAPYDLRLRKQGGRWQLLHGSGSPVRDWPGTDPTPAIEVIRKRAAVQPLLTFELQPGGFNTFLSLDPPNRGVLFEGEEVRLLMKADRQAHPLLLSIDAEATVCALYPGPRHSGAIAPDREIRLAGIGNVEPPFGTDTLLLFALDGKPAGYEKWSGQCFSSTDPKLAELMKLLAQAKGAQMKLTIVTAPRT
jgi:hypothetical protein